MVVADEERCATCWASDPGKPARFTAGPCDDPYHASAWDDEVKAETDQGPEGYVVAGPDVAGSANPGRLVADWDGEVHLTREDGDVALAECRRSGYVDWQLYALVRVAD